MSVLREREDVILDGACAVSYRTVLKEMPLRGSECGGGLGQVSTY